MNILERLATHKAIGWDVDNTLVDNPFSSKIFHDFIVNNPDKRHCIVTFRTHGLLNSLESDLRRSGFAMSLFETVLSVDPDIWLQWALQDNRRQRGNLKGKLTFPEIIYMEWKGFICKLNQLTALVDDDKTNTIRGCKRYGIEFFDTHDF